MDRVEGRRPGLPAGGSQAQAPRRASRCQARADVHADQADDCGRLRHRRAVQVRCAGRRRAGRVGRPDVLRRKPRHRVGSRCPDRRRGRESTAVGAARDRPAAAATALHRRSNRVGNPAPAPRPWSRSPRRSSSTAGERSPSGPRQGACGPSSPPNRSRPPGGPATAAGRCGAPALAEPGRRPTRAGTPCTYTYRRSSAAQPNNVYTARCRRDLAGDLARVRRAHRDPATDGASDHVPGRGRRAADRRRREGETDESKHHADRTDQRPERRRSAGGSTAAAADPRPPARLDRRRGPADRRIRSRRGPAGLRRLAARPRSSSPPGRCRRGTCSPPATCGRPRWPGTFAPSAPPTWPTVLGQTTAVGLVPGSCSTGTCSPTRPCPASGRRWSECPWRRDDCPPTGWCPATVSRRSPSPPTSPRTRPGATRAAGHRRGVRDSRRRHDGRRHAGDADRPHGRRRPARHLRRDRAGQPDQGSGASGPPAVGR